MNVHIMMERWKVNALIVKCEIENYRELLAELPIVVVGYVTSFACSCALCSGWIFIFNGSRLWGHLNQ